MRSDSFQNWQYQINDTNLKQRAGLQIKILSKYRVDGVAEELGKK